MTKIPVFDDSKELDLNTLAWVKETLLPDRSNQTFVEQGSYAFMNAIVSGLESLAADRANKIRVTVLSMAETPLEVWMFREEAIQNARWGTHGISGKEPLKWVRMIDCSSEHLLAIIRTQTGIPSGTSFVIKHILNLRGVNY